MRILLLPLFVLIASCSSIQKLALKSSSPIFADGADEMMKERSWDFYHAAAPGNLKLLESIYLQDKDNLLLLKTLVKSYAGYAYAVPETLAIEDDLAGIENSSNKRQAIDLYTRSLDYGIDYLQRKGITRKSLLDASEDELKKILSEKIKTKDYTAVLFTAQAWGSLINLQKDNVALVSHIPKVKMIFDWVCHKKPDIENGICNIFTAQYEAMLPRVAGGNPEKARTLYQDAIKKFPKHLLIRVGMIQYSLMPAFDKAGFEEQAKVLNEEFAKWDDLNRDNLTDNSEYKSQEHLNLLNAIAKKRYEIISKHQNKIFEG